MQLKNLSFALLENQWDKSERVIFRVIVFGGGEEELSYNRFAHLINLTAFILTTFQIGQ